MADLSSTFNEALVCAGYWLVNTIVYMAIVALIWFFFAYPIVREKKIASERYQNFVHKLFLVLVVLAAIGSVAAFAKVGILPFPNV